MFFSSGWSVLDHPHQRLVGSVFCYLVVWWSQDDGAKKTKQDITDKLGHELGVFTDGLNFPIHVWWNLLCTLGPLCVIGISIIFEPRFR